MALYNYLIKTAADKSLTSEAFNEFANTDTGKKILGQIAPGEAAVTAAGIGLGGLAGYALSKKYSRNADLLSRIFHSAFGAIAGGSGAQLLLHGLRDSATGMTLADQFRMNAAEGTPELKEAISNSIDQKDPGLFTLSSTISAGAGGYLSNRLLKKIPISNKLTTKIDGKLVDLISPTIEKIKNRSIKNRPTKYPFKNLNEVSNIRQSIVHNSSINTARSLAKGLRSTAGTVARGGSGALLGLLINRLAHTKALD